MQTAALARVLARHRASHPTAPRATTTAPQADTAALQRPAAPHPLLLAISRQSRVEARTMLEMARDRDGVHHPWQVR